MYCIEERTLFYKRPNSSSRLSRNEAVGGGRVTVTTS